MLGWYCYMHDEGRRKGERAARPGYIDARHAQPSCDWRNCCGVIFSPIKRMSHPSHWLRYDREWKGKECRWTDAPVSPWQPRSDAVNRPLKIVSSLPAEVQSLLFPFMTACWGCRFAATALAWILVCQATCSCPEPGSGVNR